MKLTIRHKIIFAFVSLVMIVVTACHFYLQENYLLNLFLGIILAFLLGELFSRHFIKPLKTTTMLIQDMIKDQELRKIHLSSQDEIGELARALNQMLEDMDQRLENIVSNQSRFAAVLLSMIEGVMVLDREGTIILMNQTLKDFLKIVQDPVGRRLLEVIRNIEIEEMADKALGLPKNVEAKEIILLLPEERVLWVHAAPVIREKEIDGAVLVFHDITELRRLEKVRQDFVANVSHELRTPISTIKGYAETLLDGALEDKANAKDFLQIIHADSERLTKIVNDLLDLSSVESGKMKMTFTFCSLYDVIDRVVNTLRSNAAEKSVSVFHKIPRNFPNVWADETCLAQIFLNLIENAIKYNNLKGSVTVSAREDNGRIMVDIVDTGIGIPEEDLPRIFERFYRVDKARSRQLGGTGLGLSIVKHMVQAIDGEVSVRSVLEEGSTFTISLPTS